MKKGKKMALILTIALVACGTLWYATYAMQLHTKYAKEYADVFGSYDMYKVDQYLSDDTIIVYKDRRALFKDLRANVVAAFHEKQYEMPQGSSYGHSGNWFARGNQTIGIQTYVISDEYSSDFVSMEIKRRGLFSYCIQSITSSDDFFGYLFFGLD